MNHMLVRHNVTILTFIESPQRCSTMYGPGPPVFLVRLLCLDIQQYRTKRRHRYLSNTHSPTWDSTRDSSVQKVEDGKRQSHCQHNTFSILS